LIAIDQGNGCHEKRLRDAEGVEIRFFGEGSLSIKVGVANPFNEDW